MTGPSSPLASSSSPASQALPYKDTPVSLPVIGVVRLLQIHGLLSILLEIPANVQIVEQQLSHAIKGRSDVDGLFSTLRRVQRCPHPKYIKYSRLYSEWWFTAWTTTRDDVFATLKNDARRIAPKKISFESLDTEHMFIMQSALPYAPFRRQDNAMDASSSDGTGSATTDTMPSMSQLVIDGDIGAAVVIPKAGGGSDSQSLEGDRVVPTKRAPPAKTPVSRVQQGSSFDAPRTEGSSVETRPAYKRRWSDNKAPMVMEHVTASSSTKSAQHVKSPRLNLRRSNAGSPEAVLMAQ